MTEAYVTGRFAEREGKLMESSEIDRSSMSDWR